MPYVSLNPATNKVCQTFPSWGDQKLASALEQAHTAQVVWCRTDIGERSGLLQRAAGVLRERSDEFARLITLEMGKPLREAKAEVEKCAMGCEYYALHAGDFLEPEPVETDAGTSYVAFEPLGTVLAVMPWNFPFWQVFRFAAPTLMAGNAAVLKHASCVPQCALAIEEIFRASGFPEHLFTTLMIEADQVQDAIASRFVQAVTLTGSEPAGRKVAAMAGQHLKKCVLELGGSDPFIVLADADLDYAAQMAVASRFLNCGQSCIAAKRLILVPEIADRFLALFKEKAQSQRVQG